MSAASSAAFGGATKWPGTEGTVSEVGVGLGKTFLPFKASLCYYVFVREIQ